jgi:hypothetical protein
VAQRGLRMWAACARQCPLSAQLTISAREARRIGLGRRRAQIASGRATASRSARLLTLAVPRRYRSALGGARRVSAVLEAVAGASPDPRRTARMSKTLRR